MANKNCKIFSADKMIVGRWYKLVTYHKGTYGAPWNYTVNYSCSNSNVLLLHDTVYIKSTGTFTVSCVDMYGNTDSKTIEAIAEPYMERTAYTITPTTWSDFVTKVEACGEYAHITIPKGNYTFTIPSEPYDVREGVIIDFSDSDVTINTSVTNPSGLRFLHDHSGFKNCNFAGVNMYQNEDITKNTYILGFFKGYNIHCENVHFDKTYGYNIFVGTWAKWNNSIIYATRHDGAWATNSTSGCDIINGCILDDGSVSTQDNAWTHTNLCRIRESSDRSFRVGRYNHAIPTTARMYDIAFYDNSQNLIAVMRDLQYYRKYTYPVDSVYVRFGVLQTDAPTTGGDASEVMRMLSGTDYAEGVMGVDDIYFDNISAKDHVSGVMSIVGITEDAHFNRIKTNQSGWGSINQWAWDAEDGWASMMGLVMSHSYFKDNYIIFQGAQGASVLSTISGSITCNGSLHFMTIINSVLHNVIGTSLRGFCTLINSYYYRITDTDGYGAYYAFGCHDESEASAIRSKGTNFIVD